MRTGRPDQDVSLLLSRLVQLGRVSDVDNTKHMATVYFPVTEIVSDWLYVLDNRPYIPAYSGPQQTEEAENHKHNLTINPFMPKIGDLVLVLYLPIYGADGFIIGRVL